MAGGAASDRAARGLAVGVALGLGAGVVLLRHVLSPGLRGGLGILCFIAIVAACSSNLRAIRWRTVAWGVVLQLGLALFILRFQIAGRRPGYEFFNAVAGLVKQFLAHESGRTLQRDPYGNPIGSVRLRDVRDLAPRDDDPNPRARSARLRTATRC